MISDARPARRLRAPDAPARPRSSSALELMRERVVRETERRLAGDLLADALGDRLDAEELRGRLRPFGIGGEAAVLVFELDDPPAAEATLEAALADAGVPALVATSAAAGRPLLCAVVDAGDADPIGTARRAREALAGGPGRNGVRAAASRPAGGRLAAPRLPRGPLRARGDLARRRRGARGRLAPRPRRLHAAARAPGRRRAAPLQRRPAGPDRAAPRASTAASCCARSRPSSRTTATGSGPRGSSTATATRSATGSARSRS